MIAIKPLEVRPRLGVGKRKQAVSSPWEYQSGRWEVGGGREGWARLNVDGPTWVLVALRADFETSPWYYQAEISILLLLRDRIFRGSH